MSRSTSVAGRALLALGLMVGFYVLSLVIASFLIALPVAEVVYLHRLHGKVAAFCLVGALAILWSVLPRWDRFVPPGPLLAQDRHPRLFAELERIAHATGQAMPAEVFLVGDVNAWVAQRGGVMGFLSRRVMGLGLPVLQILSVSELRAVLAHEFGHYHGGDTRLGPWVYKTRAAIGRTVGSLGDSILQAPFLWYGKMFLRVSHTVSRRQELSADALAAHVAGSRALIEGLKKVRAAAAGYQAYWSQEVAPVLQAGFLPPLAEGFRRFVSCDQVSTAMAGVVDKAMHEEATDPYDTHPSLPERIAAVSSLPTGPDPADDLPASTLLSDVDELEQQWLATLANETAVGRLTPVGWDSVVSVVFLPAWREVVRQNAAVLEGTTISDLPKFVAEANHRAARLPGRVEPNDSVDARKARVHWLASVATLLALERAGWTIEAPPGEPFSARRDGERLLPLDVIPKVAQGTLTAEDWRAETERLGVAGLALAG